MEFIETSMFTRKIYELLSDEDYAELQSRLIQTPMAGDLIEGGKGLRKIRWRCSKGNKGKRSGARVIYYYASMEQQTHMIFVYNKLFQDDLSREQLKILSAYVEDMI